VPSSAKEGLVSCPFAHQYETLKRAIASPRSASPIGPAPTREPLIALPPAIIPPLKLLLDKLENYYLSNKLKAIAEASQTPPTTIVIRSKFFSTTEEPPYVEDIPPPNRSDKPEPLPL
jgi:hypothetical protein